MTSSQRFTFLDYNFDFDTLAASFKYGGMDGIVFTETIRFAVPEQVSGYPSKLRQLASTPRFNQALFLAFVLIGTSYYKAHPTREVVLSVPIDAWQAEFFSHVYQEGLSQYAYENNLSRADLATFHANQAQTSDAMSVPSDIKEDGARSDNAFPSVLSLQSGGKDSLLTATLLAKHKVPYSAWYLSSSGNYPEILEHLPIISHNCDFVNKGDTVPILQVARRSIDLPNLKKSGGLNGHVPVTYIVQSLALIQAILNGQKYVLTSIGQEGNEAHAYIGDLEVNHQWSKTWSAEQMFAEYIRRYIAPDLHLGSPLREYTELAVAERFAQLCWKQYGHSFSSCNEANYRQRTNNQQLKWCGNCAKCTNSYLLFAPFLAPAELQAIFNHEDLFTKPSLWHFFKGLLGIDGEMKPFECVGEIDELRRAYHLKQDGYADLPFEVPQSDFDYHATGPMQKDIKKLFAGHV